MAVESGSVDDMLSVAAGWMQLGHNLLVPPDSSEEDEEEHDCEEHEVITETRVMGFGSTASREEAEREYDEKGKHASK